MTPKEKAESILIQMFRVNGLDNAKAFDVDWRCAKQCALIAVNEIIKNGFNPQLPYRYWEQVKEELKKL